MADDPVRAALQQLCDLEKQGWSVAHFVCAVGLERLAGDGTTESAVWPYAPDGQANYITDGLWLRGENARADAEDQP